MKKLNAYWRLLRLDKPVGILLLWYPTAWALWIANDGRPGFKLFCLFLMGTVIMRSAGCVINDIADRGVDKHVARTKLRPLTSGELSLFDALGILFILLCGALFIALSLPGNCLHWAIIALLITIFYPFCKRFFNAPQFVLGLAFSMGIPMVYVASGVFFNSEFILLFFINFFWIIAYDTMYAMSDKADDLKIGVKSTAIYFASYDRLIIGILQCVLHCLWLYWGLLNQVTLCFYGIWLAAGFVLIYQQYLLEKRIPENCFKAFLVSSRYGFLMWLAVGSAYLWRLIIH